MGPSPSPAQPFPESARLCPPLPPGQPFVGVSQKEGAGRGKVEKHMPDENKTPDTPHCVPQSCKHTTASGICAE